VASFVVDTLTLPVSVGGHPALDFCNTRAGWGSRAPKEYLQTHAHLALWARENDLIADASVPALRDAATRDPDAAAAVLTRAVALRSALYGVLVGPVASADWDVVNREVRAAAQASGLEAATNASGLGAGTLASWAILDQSCVDLPLLAVDWSAASLLTSPASGQVGACPGEGCGWLFVDPRGRRRWCSMAWCGNRNKVRRHAERSQKTKPPRTD
jgi:predicted RNA-binding Zn ribbon-like protein